MRFANPLHSRRGAFLFIALFSCLQITIGFFLINGNGRDSVLSDKNIRSAQLIRSEIIKGKSYIADAKTIINHSDDVINDDATIDEEAFAFLANSIEPANYNESIKNSKSENKYDIETKKLIESLATLSTINYREK